ncbi:nuclear transport factor 2 family protein [Amycolatopsis sp. NPDC047767]|uniref:YybH family protein n=1 Tax=Amycolatopsis sp. NPDC047767 TaxID=3156765 RepID=UPI003451B472
MASSFPLPTSAEDIPDALLARFNSGDVDAMEDLYAPEAVFVTNPGTTVSGWPAIREQLAVFLERKLPMNCEVRHAFVAGEVAMFALDWRLEGSDVSGVSTDIVRRGADGRWRFVIDNPFGTAAREPA